MTDISYAGNNTNTNNNNNTNFSATALLNFSMMLEHLDQHK